MYLNFHDYVQNFQFIETFLQSWSFHFFSYIHLQFHTIIHFQSNQSFIHSFIHSFISSQITLYTFYSNISRNNFSFINLQISIEAIYLLCYTDFLIQAYYIYNFFTSAVSSFNVFTAQMSGLFIFPPCQMIYNLSGTT